MSSSFTNTTSAGQLKQLNESLSSTQLLKQVRESGFPSLSDKKKVFGHLYVRYLDHRLAAEEAGYKPDYGIALIRDPLVKGFIDMLKKEHFERLEIDADFVRAQWLELVPIAAGKVEANRMLKDGSEVEAKNFDGPTLAAALKELGKMTNVYAEGSGNGRTIVNIDLGSLGLTPDQQRAVTIEGEYTSHPDDEDDAPL